jgi:DNA-binding CsgD family transcriptional regulator
LADDDRSGVLRGLVSEAAAAAYERLLAVSQLPVGPGPNAFDTDDPACGELLDAGVISISGRGDSLFARTVHPTIALRRLLDRQHRRLARFQAQLADTWERFAGMVSPTSGLGDPDPAGGGEDIQVIRDYPEVVRLAAGLYRAPKRLLRATFNGYSITGYTAEGVLLPPADAIAAGVEFRMIYDAKHASDEWGAHSIEQSVQAGEQAKVRKTMPVKMMHVDDAVALVTVDHIGSSGALHVRSPALLAMLAEWFDLLWDDPGSTAVGVTAAAELSPAQRKVLRLLASGLTDEAIAHQTDTAVRTVRRHVSAILDLLHVDSRFAAGVAAVKRGWL